MLVLQHLMQQPVQFLHLFISGRAVAELFLQLFDTREYFPYKSDSGRQLYDIVVHMVS